MNFLDRARAAMVKRLLPQNYITTSQALMDYLGGGGDSVSDTGLPVTPETAMRLSTVYACVRVLSEDIAALPLFLYEKLEKGRKSITEHWLNDLLVKPNPWQTGFELREMMQAQLELEGNFFGLKTVSPRGEVFEILPTHRSRWEVTQLPNWGMQYKFTWPDGKQDIIPPEKVFHVRGISLDGILGLSPISYQRETVAYGQALVKYGNKLFKNGANVSGVIENPEQLSPEAYARLKESFEDKYSGLDNSGKMILLEEGTTFRPTAMKADDAQFIESKKMSRSEICGIYRVPPHFIADLDKATFSNIEQQSKDYVQKALLPRLRRLEARMLLSLIPFQQRKKWYFMHDVDELLRGDFEARMRGYQTAVLTGWMTRNQVREFESLNPGPEHLDEYIVPGNEMLSKNMDENDKKAQEAKPKPAAPEDNQPKEGILRAI